MDHKQFQFSEAMKKIECSVDNLSMVIDGFNYYQEKADYLQRTLNRVINHDPNTPQGQMAYDALKDIANFEPTELR